ncbi:methylthioribulose 1-phosphate dehydratase [Sulfobacillus harzensis]|uniref:Methylthioribulose-1-phosphate dehydratase n=1 Tax=Sulfobacillus harzensis TaxID=2729629 RepID=A0A7Y0L268_9FIRM|nr:methylthioribulose 1-phosphate dehydratase [Sulfobacillus harzensis]NMP21356.1 methylthioribulose 1-phosphate dehydratase [Sulfobacillus harzensis]
MSDFERRTVDTLIGVAGELATRGWLRATSGNLSVKDPDSGRIYITRSGSDKQRLTPADVLTLSAEGNILAGVGKPSFETPVHLAIYRHTSSGAVFHVHTVYNNLVSRYADDMGVRFHDHEMLKALGHWQEDAAVTLPVVPNFAHIPQLAEAVAQAVNPRVPAVLLKKHGIYAFGETADAALRHLEAFEFLFEWLCLDRLSEAAARHPVTLS